MKSLFDPVVSEIKNLLNQQVKQAREKKNAYIDVRSIVKVCFET